MFGFCGLINRLIQSLNSNVVSLLMLPHASRELVMDICHIWHFLGQSINPTRYVASVETVASDPFVIAAFGSRRKIQTFHSAECVIVPTSFFISYSSKHIWLPMYSQCIHHYGQNLNDQVVAACSQLLTECRSRRWVQFETQSQIKFKLFTGTSPCWVFFFFRDNLNWTGCWYTAWHYF